MPYTIGEVAKMAKVTVRTLHHYDQIGLLQPSGRSHAGYRLYETEDLERLQQILLFRELGFELEIIRRIMLEPNFDRREALLDQRGLLKMKLDRMGAMLRAIDETLKAMEQGVKMDDKDMLEVFGDFDPTQYEDEVRQRWSGPLLEESQRRTRGYTKDDWQKIRAEGDALTKRLGEAMASGAKPDDPKVTRLVEEHRLYITRWFYPCSHEVHAGLGRMYVDDARFAENYEKVRPGLAQFVCDAIQANADSQGE